MFVLICNSDQDKEFSDDKQFKEALNKNLFYYL